MKTKTKKTDKIFREVRQELRKANLYLASIKVFGKLYTSTGATVGEAIANLNIPGKVGGVCILTVSSGDTKRDKIVNARLLFKLFNGSKTMREIGLKQITSLFDGL